MFNLIITIIAIILVAAVTGASVYYGGKAFNKSGADADAAALINGSQQIAAAFTLATAESKTLLGGTNGNFTSYLASVPSVKGVKILAGDTGTDAATFGTNVNTNGYLLVQTTQDICSAVAKKTSVDGTDTPATTGDLTGLYNCVNMAVTGSTTAVKVPSVVSGTYYFGYKVK